MCSKDYFMKTQDGKKIFIHYWDEVDKPKGIIQIFHGMAEHGQRYENFAMELNKNGYIVYANDHRGHGKTILNDDEYGYIDPNGFETIINDEYELLIDIKKKYKDLPIFIFGHSFGSFLAQGFIQKYSTLINGVVLSGSACNNGLDIKIGSIIAKIEMKLHGKDHRSKLLDNMSFKTANKKIDNPVSKQAWLTRDEEIVAKYDSDKYCGGIFTSSFYYAFSKGLIQIYKTKKLSNIRKNLPILILSGDKDPIGNYGKRVKKLYNLYKKIGIKDVYIKLYKDGRHEMINELNKKEVYKDIIDWFDTKLKNNKNPS